MTYNDYPYFRALKLLSNVMQPRSDKQFDPISRCSKTHSTIQQNSKVSVSSACSSEQKS